jgi:hypothetical protein
VTGNDDEDAGLVRVLENIVLAALTANPAIPCQPLHDLVPVGFHGFGPFMRKYMRTTASMPAEMCKILRT